MDNETGNQLTNLDAHLNEAFKELKRQDTQIGDLQDLCIELDNTIHNLKQVIKKFVKMPDKQTQNSFENEVNSA